MGLTSQIDPSYLVNEPNRLSEIYRNNRPIMFPVVVEDRLDFIDISQDGQTIIGSSNLTGRYQKGSIWYFNDPSLAPEKEACVTGLECESTVCDGKFLHDCKTIVVGEDSGSVLVYQLEDQEDGEPNLACKSARREHDSCVLSISVSSDKSEMVSGGMDMCIKVWDSEDVRSVHTFRSAHSHHVTCVAYSPETGSQVFASCGLDGAALVWDPRKSKPASVVIDNPSEGLSALAWTDHSTTSLAVGSAFGAVSIVDLRTMAIVRKSSPYNRSVYRLLSITQSLLAACADNNAVKIIDTQPENLHVSYTDERHTDFVRGLSFHAKTGKLYSCGWDKQVISHSLPSM